MGPVLSLSLDCTVFMKMRHVPKGLHLAEVSTPSSSAPGLSSWAFLGNVYILSKLFPPVCYSCPTLAPLSPPHCGTKDTASAHYPHLH